MQDITDMLQALKRPKTLVRAAQIACRDLLQAPDAPRRLATITAKAGSKAVLLQLMEMEAGLNAQRTERNAGYSIAHHIDVLARLLYEAQQMSTRLSALHSA